MRLVYDLRGLTGVMTTRPEVAGVLQRNIVVKETSSVQIKSKLHLSGKV
jgi:hypothetical protein